MRMGWAWSEGFGDPAGEPAYSRSTSVMRTTAAPASSEAARSTSPRMRQSWSPAGSSIVCSTFQTPDAATSDSSTVTRRGERAATAGEDLVVLVEVRIEG